MDLTLLVARKDRTLRRVFLSLFACASIEHQLSYFGGRYAQLH